MAEAGLTSGMGGVSAGVLAGKLTGKLDEIAAAHKPNADKPTSGGKTDVDSGEGADYDGPDKTSNTTGNNGSYNTEGDFGSLNQPVRSDTPGQHEIYKDIVRAQMERPNTSGSDPQLEEVLDSNYRANAEIGSGSTADAVRYETATGEQVKGRDHRQKAENTVDYLKGWLNKNENNPNVPEVDKAAARNVLKDLENSLNYKAN